MATIRYQAVLMPAVLAGAQSGPFNVATFDDNTPRRLTGLKATNVAKLTQIILDLAGRVFAVIDCGTLGTSMDFIPLDIVFPSGVLFSVNVKVLAGGAAVVVNTDEIVLRYEGAPILGSG